MKNGFVHGAIKADNISVQNDGSLIINGYDRPRRSSITPEGTMSSSGDIYGMGIVMLELFSGQLNVELPLDHNLHNSKVLEIFLQINWQEWTSQPWLITMQEYLISLLFYDPNQRPHPLDIANILKEATQTTSSLGVSKYMHQNGIQFSSAEEKLEAARSLRSSALISPVEVMADSEGTATGYFTRDKIAQMFQEPIEEEQSRRQEWTPETSLEIHPKEHPVQSFETWKESQPLLDDTLTNSSSPSSIASEPETSPTPAPPPWQKPWQPLPEPPPKSIKSQPETPIIQNLHPEPPPPIATIGKGLSNPVPPPPAPPAPLFSAGLNQPGHGQPIRSENRAVSSPATGGVSSSILMIFGSVTILLLLAIVAGLVLNKEDTSSTEEPTVQELTIEQVAPSVEPTEEFEKEPPKPVERPKPKAEKSKRKIPPKSTKAPRSAPAPKKVPAKSPKEKQPAVFSTFTTVITFANEATLQCGDGQSREFVRQTEMIFKSRTACRITSANGERGALTAQKDGTIQCTVAGEKIRCR